MNDSLNINIFGIKIDIVTIKTLMSMVIEVLNKPEQKIITYVTAYSLNIAYNNDKVKELFNNFDVVHSDGIGTFLASKFLFGKNGIQERITGSDFYPYLLKMAVLHSWKLFFFGDENKTLNKISEYNPGLNIGGIQNGFDFNDEHLIKFINENTD